MTWYILLTIYKELHAPITECLKKGELAWSNDVAKVFVKIKVRIIIVPVYVSS